MLPSRVFAGTLLVNMMVLGADVVYSEDYPNKPVRIITAAVGGGSDFNARLIAQEISAPLGQPVVVDNRANTILAGEGASKSPPDGYNLFVGGTSTWISPLLQKAPYDVVRDFLPISLIVREVLIVVVHPSLPVRSIKELIVLAKAKPGELNYASGTTGGPPHLGMELFKSMSGVNIVRIAYKSTAPATTALIGGEVQLMINDVGLAVPHVKVHRLRALAITSATPSALAPSLPTVAASGLPGFELVGMTGIFAPAKTSAAVIDRLNQEVVRVLTRADMKEKFFTAGAEVVASSPEQFAAAIKSDIAKMGKVIKDAGISAE